MPKTEDIKIPLHSLIAMLRKEGYEIGTAAMLDLQRVIANIDTTEVNKIAELKYLVGPVICRNKEEQQKFYKIYDEYVHCLDEQELVIQPEPKKEVQVKNKGCARWMVVIIAVIAILFIVVNRGTKDEAVTLGIVEKNNRKTNVAGDTVKLAIDYADSNKAKKYKTDWQISGPHFAKSFKSSAEVVAVFDSAGSYTAIASTFDDGGRLLKNDTSVVEVLCEIPPSVRIVNESTTSRNALFSAALSESNIPATAYQFHWSVNGILVAGDNTMRTKLSKADRADTVRLMVNWLGKKLHCSVDSLADELVIQPPVQVTVTGDPKSPLVLPSHYNWSNILWSVVSLLFLPFFIVGLVFSIFLNPKKKAASKTNAAGEPEAEEKKYKGPFTIEFNSQQDKITPEAGISQLAEVLRKRHTSDVFKLSIAKTIHCTIRKGGFPMLQYTPGTQPADFLILLDKEYPEGHLTNLFSYVIERLKKEQVHLTVYSFSREPLLLSNEARNHILLPIDKVARLYPETMLIIFSQADAFFRSYDVILKKWVTEKFKSWNTKLVITPAAKKDWGAKELTLYNAGFTVVPADVNAHKIISDEINHMIDRQLLKQEIVPGAYNTKQFNFNRWRQVKSYLDNAVSENNDHLNHAADKQLLEQWLCALAVYPHINWNVTVAIGKAFEEAYSLPGQLVNYTNLLILSRIQWMNDEQLMDSLRLEMLNRLDEDKQALARSVIVEMLREIAPKIPEGAAVQNEMKFIDASNKFLLNAHNKNNQSLTEEELQQFKTYLQNDQVDWALQTHLEQAENTLLKDPSDTGKSVPLDKYMNLRDEKEKLSKQNEKLQPVKTVKDFLKKIAPLAVYIIIFILTVKVLKATGKWQFTNQQKFVNLTFDPGADSLGAVQRENEIPIHSMALVVDNKTYEAKAVANGSFTASNVVVTDSVKNGTLRFNLATGEYISNFNLNSLHYNISIRSENVTADTTVTPSSNDSLPVELNEIWTIQNVYEMMTCNLSQKFFVYYSQGRIPATRINIVEATSAAAGTYRIILQYPSNNQYEAVFVRNITASSLEWGICKGNTFGKINEARNVQVDQCDKFVKGQLLYSTNAKQYDINSTNFNLDLPVNGTNLNTSQYRKQELVQKKYSGLSDAEKKSCLVTTYINTFDRSNRDITVRRAEILASSLLKGFSYYTVVSDKTFTGNAFDRDYIEIDFQNTLTKAVPSPDCSRTFRSIAEAASVRASLVCKLNLSDQKLSSIPKEVFSFINLQELNLTGNAISDADLANFKSRFPACKVISSSPSQSSVQQQIPVSTGLKSVLDAAISQIGVTNDSSLTGNEEVAKYLKAVSLPDGSSWSTAFVYWCYNSLGSNPLPKTGSADEMWSKIPSGNKILADEAFKNPDLIKPGSVFFEKVLPSGTIETGIVESVNDGTISVIMGDVIKASSASAPTKSASRIIIRSPILKYGRVSRMTISLASINLGFYNATESRKTSAY